MLELFDSPSPAFYEAYGALEPGHASALSSTGCGPPSFTSGFSAIPTGRLSSACWQRQALDLASKTGAGASGGKPFAFAIF